MTTIIENVESSEMIVMKQKKHESLVDIANTVNEMALDAIFEASKNQYRNHPEYIRRALATALLEGIRNFLAPLDFSSFPVETEKDNESDAE